MSNECETLLLTNVDVLLILPLASCSLRAAVPICKTDLHIVRQHEFKFAIVFNKNHYNIAGSKALRSVNAF